MTVGDLLDLLTDVPRDSDFTVSVDVSTGEADFGHRAYADEIIDCVTDAAGNTTLILAGELNGDRG